MLWLFSINPLIDGNAVYRSPEIFDCQFVPRNAESLAIIEATSMQEVQMVTAGSNTTIGK